MLTNSMNNTPTDSLPPHPAEAVPRTEPQWSYQERDLGFNSQGHMISYLLADKDKNSSKQVNCQKIKEVTQDLSYSLH
jgi:hypothetical protein